MATWSVDGNAKPGILMMRMQGTFNLAEMQAFHKAHNAAIDALGGQDYRVFLDIRDLMPLPQGAAALMEQCKVYSSSQPNFRGSAVWVKTKIVAMQHRRTSDSSGVLSTELISEDEGDLWAHLKTINR